jgi:hypothetical protein
MPHDMHAVYLSDARRQVQIADHLLTVTFPLVHDTKLLVSVAEHMKLALESAANGVVEEQVSRGAYERPAYASDTITAFEDLTKVRGIHLPDAARAMALLRDLRQVLREHKDAHNVFSRDGKIVIATHAFTSLRELSEQDLRAALPILKRFIAATQVTA